MRVVVRPFADPGREIDMTKRLVAAIAEELWRLYGGNGELNWLEAEIHLRRIVGEARAEAAALEAGPDRRHSRRRSVPCPSRGRAGRARRLKPIRVP